jgi:hypothetical protein
MVSDYRASLLKHLVGDKDAAGDNLRMDSKTARLAGHDFRYGG